MAGFRSSRSRRCFRRPPVDGLPRTFPHAPACTLGRRPDGHGMRPGSDRRCRRHARSLSPPGWGAVHSALAHCWTGPAPSLTVWSSMPEPGREQTRRGGARTVATIRHRQGEWRNWQTRRIQVPVSRKDVGSSPLRPPTSPRTGATPHQVGGFFMPWRSFRRRGQERHEVGGLSPNAHKLVRYMAGRGSPKAACPSPAPTKS